MRIRTKVNGLLPVLALLVAGAQFAPAQTVLLGGASTPANQSWTAFGTSTPAATITNNGTYTEISTLGTTGGSGGTSGYLLYSKAVTLSSLPTFQIDFSLQVVTGSGVHNLLDAPVAFGTGIDGFGTSVQRSQMLYFDPAQVGWADDTGSFAMDTTSGFHTYSLSVNTGTGVALLSVDGVPRLSRNGYVASDKVSFGDQTNDANVNGDFRIANITVVPEPTTLGLVGLGGALLLIRRRQARQG